MRIIKLSKKNESEFAKEDGVRKFFSCTIQNRKPPGIFRVTKGRIADGALEPGEQLLFTYEARVMFIALAKSELMLNSDAQSAKYPKLLVVDCATLRQVDEDLREVEEEYKKRRNALYHKNFIGQGWNRILDPRNTAAMFAKLQKKSRPIPPCAA